MSSSPPGQEPVAMDLAQVKAELENRHVRVVRLTIPGRRSVQIKAPSASGVLVSPRAATLRILAGTAEPLDWKADSGSAIAIARAQEVALENKGDQPAELLAVLHTDPVVYGRVSRPGSMLDPLLVDPQHFRVALENGLLRVFVLHLGPGESSPQAQFAAGLRLALTGGKTLETTATQTTREVTASAGSVTWVNDDLHATQNLEDKPMESLLLEWKKPFCYLSSYLGPDPSERSVAYIEDVLLNVRHNWYSSLPYEAKLGGPGLVQVDFKIQNDGTVRGDDIVLTKVFASERLTRAALSAVRNTAPFQPLTGTFAYPELEIHAVFLYNLPADPPGCD